MSASGNTYKDSVMDRRVRLTNSLAALKQVYGLTSNSTSPRSLSTIKLKPGYGLCCCCLENICHKNIWKEYIWLGTKEVYGAMVEECFQIELPQQGARAGQICEVCIGRVRSALKFRRQLLRCQARLAPAVTCVADATHADDSTSPQPKKLKKEVAVSPVDLDVHPAKLQRIKLEIDSDGFDDEDSGLNSSDAAGALAASFTSFDSTSGAGSTMKPVKVKTEFVDTTVRNTSKPAKMKKKLIVIKVPSRNTVVSKRTVIAKRAPVQKMPLVGNFAIKTRINAYQMIKNSTICPFRYRLACFKCFYCGQQYTEFGDLRSHCDETHANITNKMILKSINRPNDSVKADISDIKCKLCGEQITNIDELVKHLTEKHNLKFNYKDMSPNESIIGYDLSDNTNKCAICKRQFIYFKTLSSHMNEHSNKHVCDSCGRCFLLASRLKTHVSCCHQKSEVKCKICNKMYASPQVLLNHVRYTHEKRPFPCSICGETFSNYKLRLDHFVKAHGKAELNLKCEECDKKFSCHSSLTHHIRRSHLKVLRPAKYECQECGRKFREKCSLKNHMVVHTGEKDHECQFCHKKYSRLKSLKEHLKIHNNDKRWSCKACGQAFVQKCSLRNHIRVHHADLEVEEQIVYTKPE